MSAKSTHKRWEAYRELCVALRPPRNGEDGDSNPPTLPDNPCWEETLQLASHHLVAPALAFALRDETKIPEDVREFLDATLTLNRERNRNITNTLVSALEIWDSANLPSILLKGTASLASDLYRELGVRMMVDIDVLVPIERAEEALALLTANGFEPCGPDASSDKRHHHLVPLRHSQSGTIVEIHRHILRSEYQDLLPTESAWRKAKPMTVGGVTTHILPPGLRFVHALAHTQLHDSGHIRRSFSLRQMLELAMLAQSHAEEMDWKGISETFRAAGHYAALQNTMEFMVRMLGAQRPAEIAAPARNPLRSLERRLQGKHELPHYMIGYYLNYYRGLIARRPHKLLKLFSAKSLAHHFDSKILEPWRSARWR